MQEGFLSSRPGSLPLRSFCGGGLSSRRDWRSEKRVQSTPRLPSDLAAAVELGEMPVTPQGGPQSEDGQTDTKAFLLVP